MASAKRAGLIFGCVKANVFFIKIPTDVQSKVKAEPALKATFYIELAKITAKFTWSDEKAVFTIVNLAAARRI